MASGRSREIFETSDSEEEVFVGLTMEEIVQIREERQRRRQQQNLSSSDQNFDDSTDIELFFDEEDEGVTAEYPPLLFEFSSVL